MSIESEIARLQQAKDNLKDSINTKGGTITDETMDEYATAINNLPSGDLTIEGQQIITGILTGAVDKFDTVYSKIISGGSNWDTVHNKLSDPADLPAGIVHSVSFSSDDTYLAVAIQASTGKDNVIVYKRNGDVFTKIGIGALTGLGLGVSFSNNDTYLAVALCYSPYFEMYKRSGDAFNEIYFPTPVAGQCNKVSFSSDDTYLAVACSRSPYLVIYKRSGDTFTKLSKPSTVPTGDSSNVSFSSDATYLAVTHSISPFLMVYKRSGDVFKRISVSAPPGTQYLGGSGVSFSNNDTYLAVTHRQSPYITMYKRSGDAFNKIYIPALPGGGGGVSFSSDDTYLAVTHSTTPFLTVYKRSGDAFTKLTGIAALPGARGVSFSSDDTYLAVGRSEAPFITVYKTTFNNPTTLISPALNEVPLKSTPYHDLGYALESGVENDEIDMVSIFR